MTAHATAAPRSLLAAMIFRFLQDRDAPKSFLAGWPTDIVVAPQTPTRLPVLRHLPAAMGVTGKETEALAALLIAAVGGLQWWQSHSEAELGRKFIDNFGWTEIFRADRLACGFLVLGPRTEYPTHRQAPEEICIPLAGTAFWQRGNRPFAPRPPGMIIHHPSWLPHAMRTSEEPLLALYVWRGDLLEGRTVLG
jgi:hypothetical protein